MDPDPLRFDESGSTSGNEDLDPGSKKNRDIIASKSTKIIRIIIFFFKEITFLHMNNKLQNYTQKT